jgi:hypothetical protein
MSVSDFRVYVREFRRLCILRVLAAAPGYEANDALLASAVEGMGVRGSTDQLRADIAWLDEQGLLGSETMGALLVVKVTARGVDVAQGLAVVPGVAKPRPGDEP